MLCDCVGDVMDVCIVRLGAVGARSCMGTVSVSSCRCCMFVCILWQFSILHDLTLVNVSRGYKRHTLRAGLRTAL